MTVRSRLRRISRCRHVATASAGSGIPLGCFSVIVCEHDTAELSEHCL